MALVLSWLVSVYFVPYLGTVLLKVKPHVWVTAAARLFDTPFYTAFGAVNWCVQHRWITIGATIADLCAGHCGHGQGAAAVLPGFQPPRNSGGPVVARGHQFAANEAWPSG
jgi:multidrug efflux pump